MASPKWEAASDISTHWTHFHFQSAEASAGFQPWDDAFAPYYDMLWNVTVADRVSKSGINKAYLSNAHKDYQPRFKNDRLLATRSLFSMGQTPGKEIDLNTPSIEAFDKKRFFLFYRTRKE